MNYGEMIAFASLLLLLAGALLKVLVTDPLAKINTALDKLADSLDKVNKDVAVMQRDLSTCWKRYDELKDQVDLLIGKEVMK